MHKPTIYVVNAAGHSYDAAHEFSPHPMVHLSEGRVNIFDTSQITAEFAEKLQNFHPEYDYLLLSGSPVLTGIALCVLKETYGLESINVLLFHAGINKYIARRLDGYVEQFYREEAPA
jgi:hypothetical protein